MATYTIFRIPTDTYTGHNTKHSMLQRGLPYDATGFVPVLCGCTLEQAIQQLLPGHNVPELAAAQSTHCKLLLRANGYFPVQRAGKLRLTRTLNEQDLAGFTDTPDSQYSVAGFTASAYAHAILSGQSYDAWLSATSVVRRLYAQSRHEAADALLRSMYDCKRGHPQRALYNAAFHELGYNNTTDIAIANVGQIVAHASEVWLRRLLAEKRQRDPNASCVSIQDLTSVVPADTRVLLESFALAGWTLNQLRVRSDQPTLRIVDGLNPMVIDMRYRKDQTLYNLYLAEHAREVEERAKWQRKQQAANIKEAKQRAKAAQAEATQAEAAHVAQRAAALRAERNALLAAPLNLRGEG